MPRDASLSDSCTPDWCCFSSLNEKVTTTHMYTRSLLIRTKVKQHKLNKYLGKYIIYIYSCIHTRTYARTHVHITAHLTHGARTHLICFFFCVFFSSKFSHSNNCVELNKTRKFTSEHFPIVFCFIFWNICHNSSE